MSLFFVKIYSIITFYGKSEKAATGTYKVNTSEKYEF